MVTPSTSASSTNSSEPTEEELAALAQMTGYQNAPGRDAVAQPLEAAQSSSEAGLLDEEDLEEAPETQAATPIWSNPFAKGGFVALLMAIAFGTIGLFLLSVGHHWDQKEAQAVDQNPPASAPPAPDAQQNEIGDLKTKEALGSQDQLLQQNSRNNGGHILPAPPQSKASPLPTPSAARPVPIAYPPARSDSTPHLQMAARSPQFSMPAPSVSTASAQPVDPQQAWQTAQALGSYGQTATPASFNPSAASSPSLDSNSPGSPGLSDQQRYDADAAALLSGDAGQVISIAPGTTAQAELVTPIIWAQDLKPEEQPQMFDIQLSQPLNAADGSIALPGGTRLVASVGTVSASGLMELTVENAIVPTGDGSKMVPVPPGAIVISSDGGKPLIAENYRSDRGALLGHDIETALLGALSEVGTLLNRPRNESTTTSPYLSSTSVTNGNTNIVGGVLEGAFSALQSSLSQREQSQVQTVLARPSLWYIKAGKSMQVFVNSPVEVRM